MTSFDAAPSPWTPSAGLRSALAVAGVLVFFTNLDNYAYLFWSAPTPINLVWVFVGSAAMLLVLDVGAPWSFLKSPLVLWAGAFFLVTSAWAVWTAGSPASSGMLRAYYRSIGLLAAFVVIFAEPRARRAGALAVIAAVVFASCLNVAELLGTYRFAGQEELRVAGRSAGLYVNANVAGLAIVFGLAIAVHSVPRVWRIPLLVLGALGVAATFSRGAAICLAVLVPLLVWRRQIGGWPAALACALVVALLSAEGKSAVRLLDSRGALTADTSARIEFDADDSGRLDLAREAWRTFLEAPLLGSGMGATVQSHNQFLTLAGDHGLVGLLLLPALALAIALSNPGAVPFALVLLVAGFFSHNLLDDRGSLLALALAAAGSAGALEAPERDRSDPGLGEAGIPAER